MNRYNSLDDTGTPDQWLNIWNGGTEEFYLDGSLRKVSFVQQEPRERDSYGEAYQDDSEAGLIVKDEEGNYYRKECYESSYTTDVEFEDYHAIRRVQAHPRTVIDWKPV